jgi:glycosyltransferase involved in cell wall biosynthesis
VPRVTIAIPTYKADPRLLREAVSDALAQTYRDREVWIVDDGSSAEALEAAAALGPVRILKNEERQGLPGNWNRCVERASSELLQIAHQDDRMAPRFLERAVEALDRHPSAGFVHSGWRAIDLEGKPMPRGWAHLDADHGEDFFRRGRAYFGRVLEHTSICCPTAVFRRRVFDDVGLFDTRYKFAADLDMWFRLLLRHDVAYVAEVLFSYRLHPSSMTWTYPSAKVYAETLEAKRSALERAAAAGAIPRRRLRELRSHVARDCCRYARRMAWRSPEFIPGYLDLARRLDPGSVVSEAALVALLRSLLVRVRPRAVTRT